MKHIIYTIATLVFLSGGWDLMAQGLDDALQISRQERYGSARFNAMGGAFSALGGDLAAIHSNPAAAGVFNKSEIGFTLGLGSTGVNSTYYGTRDEAQSGRLNVNNMGVLFASEINHPDWRVLNIGITYARTNDFNRRTDYTGTQSDHSFAQELVGIANSGSFSMNELQQQYPFSAGPAFQAFVIDTLASPSADYFSVIDPNDEVTQELELQENGRTSEFELSLGTNYKDRLYIGVGLKIGTLVLERSLDHFEVPTDQSELREHRYSSDLEIRGTSYAVSAGIIARLSNLIRVGVSAQTPHFYVNNEFFSNGFVAELSGDYLDYAQGVTGSTETQFFGSSPEGNNRYNFNTPWRFTGGLAAVFGKNALLSAEYEYLDYSTAQFGRNSRSGVNYDFEVENADIEAVLAPTHNIRAGFEYRMLPYSFRAGYVFAQDPVASNFRGDVNRNSHQFSAGAGVRFKKVYLDAAYFYRATGSQYALYGTGTNEAADLSINQHGVSFTIGIRY